MEDYEFIKISKRCKDLTGQRFGKLVAIGPIGYYSCKNQPKKNVIWLFQCDCGLLHKAISSLVTDGSIRSCGCTHYRTDVGKHWNFKDITNKRFSKLVAIEPTGKRIGKNKTTEWKCKCDCGSISYHAINNLQSGKSKSCGCINRSRTGKNSNLYIDGRMKDPDRLFKYALNRNYNLSFDDYNKMIENQNNQCAICNKEFESRKETHIDHNHETNKVRGLLCSNCNTGLGLLKDSIDMLKNAISYLDRNDNV